MQNDLKIQWKKTARSKVAYRREEAWQTALEDPDTYHNELLLWFCTASNNLFRWRLYEVLPSATKQWIQKIMSPSLQGLSLFPSSSLPQYVQKGAAVQNWLKLATSTDEVNRQLAFELAKQMREKLQEILWVWLLHMKNTDPQQQLYETVKPYKEAKMYRKYYKTTPFPSKEEVGFYYFTAGKDEALTEAILRTLLHKKQSPLTHELFTFFYYTDLKRIRFGQEESLDVGVYFTNLKNAFNKALKKRKRNHYF
ncbi:MAG: hypothetical protein ACFB0B_21790 [Thermonemataceae bacterium]